MGRKLSKEEKEHEQRLQQELQAKLDMKYMKEAMKQARKAYALREVPIGCIIVYQDKIIGRGYNRRTIDKNTLAHAELQAIRKASRKMNDWRLEDCTLYGHPGTMPDVFRGDRAVQNQACGSRMYEPESGLCRIYFQSFTGASV